MKAGKVTPPAGSPKDTLCLMLGELGCLGEGNPATPRSAGSWQSKFLVSCIYQSHRWKYHLTSSPAFFKNLDTYDLSNKGGGAGHTVKAWLILGIISRHIGPSLLGAVPLLRNGLGEGKGEGGLGIWGAKGRGDKKNLRREMPLFSILYFHMELPTLLPRQTHRCKHRHTQCSQREEEESQTWNQKEFFLPPSLSFPTCPLRVLGRLSPHSFYKSHPFYPQA